LSVTNDPKAKVRCFVINDYPKMFILLVIFIQTDVQIVQS